MRRRFALMGVAGTLLLSALGCMSEENGLLIAVGQASPTPAQITGAMESPLPSPSPSVMAPSPSPSPSPQRPASPSPFEIQEPVQPGGPSEAPSPLPSPTEQEYTPEG